MVEVYAIEKADLDKWQSADWVQSQLESWESAQAFFQASDFGRITDWEVACTKCHNIVFQWLVEWVGAGYAVFYAKGYTAGEGVLFGFTKDMPGFHKVEQLALPSGYSDWPDD